ncbi:hypothetical protein M885DRAFT_512829 [Pelagophyceae sp. CCMP2097]|nr:hypothetical protein M885DRAFT_512829 [Pelagophyceae sp. CCMP2097]
MLTLTLLLAVQSALSFTAPVAVRASSLAAAKGFAEKAAPKEKSSAKIEKERAAAAYEAAKSKGIPEYRVHVKPTGSDKWMPVGCLTIPRSESVAQAIFANLEPLKNAAFAADPTLRKTFENQGFDYGYNLAIFKDDPVRIADPADAQATTNPFAKWVKDLTSPVNAKDASKM